MLRSPKMRMQLETSCSVQLGRAGKGVAAFAKICGGQTKIVINSDNFCLLESVWRQWPGSIESGEQVYSNEAVF